MSVTEGTAHPTGYFTMTTAGATTTVSKRSRKPSTSPSRELLYMWCQFRLEDLPYRQQHVQTMLSIFYRQRVNDITSHHLSETQLQYLTDPHLVYPCTLTDQVTPNVKQAYLTHHKVFSMLAESVLLAAMRQCDWDIWGVYEARLKYGVDGYYRNRKYPSWKESGAKGSVASQIYIPDDVKYRTIAALFGSWGLDMPPTTLPERHQERRRIRTEEKMRHDMLEGEEVDEADHNWTEDYDSDEDGFVKAGMEKARDPTHVPSPLSSGCRADCLNYVNSLAYHHLSNNLVKRVLKWIKEQQSAKRAAERAYKELKIYESDIIPCRIRRLPSQNEDSFQMEMEYTAGDREEKRTQYLTNLKKYQNSINRYSYAIPIIDPRQHTDDWLDANCSYLQELAGVYDRSLQLEAKGNPAMLKKLARSRKTEEFTIRPDPAPIDEDNQDDPERPPEMEDIQEFMTVQDCHSTTPYEPQAHELRPHGFPLHDFTDENTPYRLAGLDLGRWPGLNQSDPIYGSEKRPIAIIPRRHCCEGAVEVVSRAFQHDDRSDDPKERSKSRWNTDYSRGCIIGDATGMGKTTQAIQIIGLVSHLAFKYRDVDNDERFPDRHTFPPMMLANRAGLLDTLKEDCLEDPQGYEPIESIERHMREVESHCGPGIGTFAHTGRTAPPCRPSIIVTPPALINHWKNEITRFAGNHLLVVQIMDQRSCASTLTYVSGVQTAWDRGLKEGKDMSELDNPSNICVLVSTNLLGRIWADRARHCELGEEAPLSVYDLDFALMIFDEVHLAKGKGLLHTASHHLAKQSAFTIGQSATPLVNSPLDLCFVANALDFPQAMNIGNTEYFPPDSSPSDLPTIPEFFREARYQLGVQRKLDRGIMGETMKLFYCPLEPIPTGERPTTYLSAPISEAKNMKELQASSPAEIALDPDYIRAAKTVFNLFGGYLISRGKYAIHPSGERMLPLGELREVVVNVALREDEVEDINTYLERVCEDRIRKWGTDKDYKDKLGYFGPTYTSAKAATIAPSYFVRGLPQNNGDASRTRTSSKIGAMLDIITARTRKDNANKVKNDVRAKFVVHCDSKEVEAIFLYELAARGMSARMFDGTCSDAERRKIEQEVNEDEDHPATPYGPGEVSKTRILFCTPVAGVGINLFRTNVVINLTMPWSQFLYDQRIGRHHRTPPDRTRALLPVDVYTILAINSVDLAMYTASAVKSRLKITSFRHPETNEIQGLLTPAKNIGARRRKISPHLVPNIPKYQVPFHLKAIDYQHNPMLIVNDDQFEILFHLGVIPTLKHLRLCNIKLDVLVVEQALEKAMDEGEVPVMDRYADRKERPADDLSLVDTLVVKDYIPQEVAENAKEEKPKAGELFKKKLQLALSKGAAAKDILPVHVVITADELEKAEKATFPDWEQSMIDANTTLKNNELERLRVFEDKIWAMIRSTKDPLGFWVRKKFEDFQALIPERNKLANSSCFVPIFEIPTNANDFVEWAKLSVHLNKLETLPVNYQAPPQSPIPKYVPLPVPAYPPPIASHTSLLRPPLATSHAAQLAQAASQALLPLGSTTARPTRGSGISSRVTRSAAAADRVSLPLKKRRDIERTPLLTQFSTSSRPSASEQLRPHDNPSSSSTTPRPTPNKITETGSEQPRPTAPPRRALVGPENVRLRMTVPGVEMFYGDRPVIPLSKFWYSHIPPNTTRRTESPSSASQSDQNPQPQSKAQTLASGSHHPVSAKDLPATATTYRDNKSRPLDESPLTNDGDSEGEECAESLVPRESSLDRLFASDSEVGQTAEEVKKLDKSSGKANEVDNLSGKAERVDTLSKKARRAAGPMQWDGMTSEERTHESRKWLAEIQRDRRSHRYRPMDRTPPTPYQDTLSDSDPGKDIGDDPSWDDFFKDGYSREEDDLSPMVNPRTLRPPPGVAPIDPINAIRKVDEAIRKADEAMRAQRRIARWESHYDHLQPSLTKDKRKRPAPDQVAHRNIKPRRAPTPTESSSHDLEREWPVGDPALFDLGVSNDGPGPSTELHRQDQRQTAVANDGGQSASGTQDRFEKMQVDQAAGPSSPARVIGHRAIGTKNYRPWLKYLIQLRGETAETAKWFLQEDCGGYPVLDYLSGDDEATIGLKGRRQYTLDEPEIRRWWTSRGERVWKTRDV